MYFEITSTDQFEKFTTNAGGCIVDFHAKWCGPCKRVSPVLEAKMLSDPDILPFIVKPDNYVPDSDLSNKIVFLKVDVDFNKELSDIFKVSKIPYFVFYKKGELQSHTVSGPDVSAIEAEVRKLLPKSK